MYTEQITLAIGSEYARSQAAADQYAKVTAAEARRSERRHRRPRLDRIARLTRRPRLRAARLLPPH